MDGNGTLGTPGTDRTRPASHIIIMIQLSFVRFIAMTAFYPNGKISLACFCPLKTPPKEMNKGKEKDSPF